jgi:Synergist-CTERM protein sorting domain-containing protein
MKFVKKRMLIIAALIAVITTASVPVFADVAYLISTNGYSPDGFGLIWGKGAPTGAVVSNLGGNSGAKMAAFKTPSGGVRLAVCQYTGSRDTIWIYNPYDPQGWKKPLKELGSAGNPIWNIRGMAAMGKYLYAAGYDQATVARYDVTDDKYSCDKLFANFRSAEDASGSKYHAEGIVTYKGYVYVVFTYADSPWAGDGGYADDKLVKFDKDLNIVTSIDLECKNTDGEPTGAYTLHGNKLFVTGIGGAQSYSGEANKDSSIVEVDLDKMTSKMLISNRTLLAKYGDSEKVMGIYPKSSWPLDFKSIAITPSGDVYVQSSGWNYDGNSAAIFKTSVAQLESGDLGNTIKEFSFSAFVFQHMAYDAEQSLLYTCAGEGNDYMGVFYVYDGASWNKYDNKALGGAIQGLELLPKPTIETISSGDLSVSSDFGWTSMSNIEISNDFADLNGKDDYSGIVSDLDSTYTVYPGKSIKLTLNRSALPDDASVTFTIANFTSRPSAGGEFKAFIKKRGAASYDMFDTNYDAAAQTLSFTIKPVGDYSDNQTIVIGELAKKKVQTASSDHGTDTDNRGDTAGGCNAGFAAAALLAFVPVVLRHRRGR